MVTFLSDAGKRAASVKLRFLLCMGYITYHLELYNKITQEAMISLRCKCKYAENAVNKKGKAVFSSPRNLAVDWFLRSSKPA